MDQQSFPDRLRQTARLIAEVHRTRIPLHKKRDPFRETQSLRRWAPVLQNLRSDLAKRIRGLHESFQEEMLARTTAVATVHGDFHPSNVLVDHETVYLIDFDQMALGDPCADIGRFLASFRIKSLKKFGNLNSFNDAAEIFLEEYLRNRIDDVFKIRLFEAASLFTTAASSFRLQRSGWQDEMMLLLEEAERIFSESRP